MERGQNSAFGSFSVIVPMYNEETGAETCVRRICEVLSRVSFRSKLIAVNDGSRDETAKILNCLSTDLPNLTVIHHDTNRGYGAALRTGIGYAVQGGFDYTLFMDSDLTNDPADIPRFVEKMKDGYDVIKATRYSDGGEVKGVPAYRVIISRLGNWIASRLYGLPITDCTNGFRAIRTSLLSRMELAEKKFPIIMEELYYSSFFATTFVQIPVRLTNRQAEQRRTSFVYRPRVFYDYIKYPLKTFFRIKPQESVLGGEKR
jgi:glycosyltransferase involved in cell wall biosynthesis